MNQFPERQTSSTLKRSSFTSPIQLIQDKTLRGFPQPDKEHIYFKSTANLILNAERLDAIPSLLQKEGKDICSHHSYFTL